MRRGAVSVGYGAALLALAFSGCAPFDPLRRAGHHHGNSKHVDDSQRSEQCQALSEAAQLAIDRGDAATAIAQLRELVALEPQSAEAHQRLGRVYQSEQRLAEAESEYGLALALDKEYVAALIGLGAVNAALGRPAPALARFESAIELDPRQPDAHLGRGRALEALGRSSEALAAYFRALEFAPNSRDARLHVAMMQLAQHEPDQALAKLELLVEQFPDDAESRHQRGRAQLALGHFPRAVEDFQIAAAKLSNRPDVYYHLALGLAGEHHTRAALAAAERALQIDPAYAAARALSQQLRR
jgi:tetratricopeptide (TPR) repeat protein